MVTDSVAQAHLADEFTCWHIWRSERGGWWATRCGEPLSDAQLVEGMYATVSGGDADQLRTELLLQRIAEDHYAEAAVTG